MPTPFRTLTNKPGTTYDADRTSTVYAEDINAMSEAINTLEEGGGGGGSIVGGFCVNSSIPAVASDMTVYPLDHTYFANADFFPDADTSHIKFTEDTKGVYKIEWALTVSHTADGYGYVLPQKNASALAYVAIDWPDTIFNTVANGMLIASFDVDDILDFVFYNASADEVTLQNATYGSTIVITKIGELVE